MQSTGISQFSVFSVDNFRSFPTGLRLYCAVLCIPRAGLLALTLPSSAACFRRERPVEPVRVRWLSVPLLHIYCSFLMSKARKSLNRNSFQLTHVQTFIFLKLYIKILSRRKWPFLLLLSLTCVLTYLGWFCICTWPPFVASSWMCPSDASCCVTS